VKPAERSLHPMSVVMRRTGLSADVLRAWERRHAAVTPSRTPGNQRLYSDAQVERLRLLRQAVEAGWPIGQLAPRSDAELRALVVPEAPSAAPPVPPAGFGSAERDAPALGATAARRRVELRQRALEALSKLDGEALAAVLDEAAAELGRVALVEGFVAPLVAEVGDAVESGAIRIAHEHLASATVLRFLEGLAPAYAPTEGAPRLVATTTVGVHHAVGAALAAAVARLEGWRATYLGPNLPAEEIAAAVRLAQADLVALSLVPPIDGARTDAELSRLGRLLAGRARVVAGGAAAADRRAALESIGGVVLPDLAGFRALLHARRAGRPR
jgi:MerR family transcriptional regulator, light-induced transcriptional regulator